MGLAAPEIRGPDLAEIGPGALSEDAHRPRIFDALAHQNPAVTRQTPNLRMEAAARIPETELAGPLSDRDAEDLVALDDLAVGALVEAEKAQQHRRKVAVLFVTEAARLTMMMAVAGYLETTVASEMQALLVLIQHCDRDMLRFSDDGTFVPSCSCHAHALPGSTS